MNSNPRKFISDLSLVKLPHGLKAYNRNKDCVPCILQPGEIVIPVKYVGLVEPYLERLGIYKNGKFQAR